MLAGLAGATELLGHDPPDDRVVRHDRRLRLDRRRPARAHQPDRDRARGAALRRACAPASAAMQIQAGVPAELVDVLQATILFFLVASPVIKRVFRLQRRRRPASEDATTITEHLRRGGDDPLMDQFLYGIPVIGLVFQFVGYLIAILPVIAPIILRRRDADRASRRCAA